MPSRARGSASGRHAALGTGPWTATDPIADDATAFPAVVARARARRLRAGRARGRRAGARDGGAAAAAAGEHRGDPGRPRDRQPAPVPRPRARRARPGRGSARHRLDGGQRGAAAADRGLGHAQRHAAPGDHPARERRAGGSIPPRWGRGCGPEGTLPDGLRGPEPALVVVDLATGRARRVLAGHASVTADGDHPVRVDGEGVTQGTGANARPAHTGVDPITIDPTNTWMYYGPMSATGVYRVPAADLARGASGSELESGVERRGDKPVSDGITIDGAGNVDITDLGGDAVGVTAPDGTDRRLIEDERLGWPDGFAAGPTATSMSRSTSSTARPRSTAAAKRRSRPTSRSASTRSPTPCRGAEPATARGAARPDGRSQHGNRTRARNSRTTTVARSADGQSARGAPRARGHRRMA